MTGFSNVGAYAGAWEAGRSHSCAFRKVPSQATVAGWWADLSMAAGNPPPNYYASSPLVAATLDSYRGIFHGPDQPSGQKYLTHLGLITPTAAALGRYMLLDYIAYYPFVDCDDTDTQTLDNTVTLPRYADGDGVMAMAVAVAPTVGGGAFSFNYVNQDGASRTSPTQVCSTTSASIASLATSQQAVAGMPGGPFLLLASGDTGIRSITDVTFSVANGGLIALVLVKPLANLAIFEINTEIEREFVTQRAVGPRIYDGAYLGLITNCAGSIAAATIKGSANFIWSE